MLLDGSVRALLDAFGAPDPTPGGGSASALAAAVGASLLTMVASLPKTRSGSDEYRDALARAADALDTIRGDAATAIDADTAAYDQVVAAYKRPKATAEEREGRTAAIQQALRTATDVPLRVMRVCRAACVQGRVVAAHGHRAAASDVGVALALLRAAVQGARLNVDINLESLTDAAYVAAAKDEAAMVSDDTSRLAAEAEALLRNG